MTDPIADLLKEVDAELGQQEDASAEEAPAEQPRDEQGRFAAQQPEAESQPEPEAAAEDEEKILGKFKSPDDLAKSYTELEDKLNEQGAELGHLRRLARDQQLYAQQQASDVQINNETVDWFDQQAMENPQGAAVWAMQHDSSGVLYNRAMEQWYDASPRQAAAFERQLEMSAMAQAVDHRLSNVTLPLRERQAQQDFTDVWAEMQTAHPDIADHAEAIVEAAKAAPEVLAIMQTGTIDDKRRVVENLYYLAMGRQATSLSQAAQDMAAQQAQETQTAKAGAFVASSGSRNESDARSPAERWLEEVFDPAASQYYGS